MDFSVDKNVPVPRTRRKIPIENLEPGESMVFAVQDRKYVQTKASVLKAKVGMEFTVRAISDDECRVWRVQ